MARVSSLAEQRKLAAIMFTDMVTRARAWN